MIIADKIEKRCPGIIKLLVDLEKMCTMYVTVIADVNSLINK